jgi:hypothetical protein
LFASVSELDLRKFFLIIYFQMRARKSKAKQQSTDVRVPRELTVASAENRVFRRLLSESGTLTTGAGGYVGLVQVIGTNNITSAGSWGSYAAVALEYRVRAIEVTFIPVVNAQTNFTTPVPCMLAVGVYSSGLVPSTYPGVAEGPNSSIHNALRPFKKSAEAKNFPNSLFWTAVGSAIATANTYGIVAVDPATVPAGPATTVFMRFTARFLVEFRSLI